MVMLGTTALNQIPLSKKDDAGTKPTSPFF